MWFASNVAITSRNEGVHIEVFVPSEVRAFNRTRVYSWSN